MTNTRESIARIIDPRSWDLRDALHRLEDTEAANAGRHAAGMKTDVELVAASITKADAILSAVSAEAVAWRRVSDEARRVAAFYPEGADGRNTFVIFAEWADCQSGAEQVPDVVSGVSENKEG